MSSIKEINMTYEKFIKHINSPSTPFNKESEKELKELIQKYPYFHIANWTYLKLLKQSNSTYYEKQLSKTILHTSDRHKLYFYVHPEELIIEVRERLGNSNGSYFDMIEKIEQNGDKTETKENSLKNLALRLKAAREKTIMESKKKEKVKKITHIYKEKEKKQETPKIELIEKGKSDEQLVNIYIQQQRYSEAIQLLEKLKNLNNSKKSVYFADQISFLKKIIENQ
ncbi:MAG: hypothetical protein CR965_00240 [Paludibacter sp.]|nr:MAG: hypothetical protein CR965_00240 [Paludibacter sp.]